MRTNRKKNIMFSLRLYTITQRDHYEKNVTLFSLKI